MLSGRTEHVWFGGGKLAADLSLPRLQARWTGGPRRPNPYVKTDGRAAGSPLTSFERARVFAHAHLAAEQATAQTCAHDDPDALADTVWASADLFAAAARISDGRQRAGPVNQAAERYARAAMPSHRRRADG